MICTRTYFFRSNYEQEKNNNLINLSRKIGQTFCDEYTFEETPSKDIARKWKYQGDVFKISSKKSSIYKIRNYYAKMRKKLREGNFEAPSESSMRLVSNFAKAKELVLLYELWKELGNDKES